MKCPPGYVCIDSVIGVTLIVLGIIMICFLFFSAMTMRLGQGIGQGLVGVLQGTEMGAQPASAQQRQQTALPIPVPIAQENRYARAPQPLRDWMAPPEFPPRGGIASIPINIPTQGLPESFHTVGVVNVEDDVWPIYGRRTGGSSDRWNYYTRNNTYNPVPLPIRSKGRDCMDQVGCQEVFSGDNVTISVLGKSGQVNIYQSDGPRYIAGLV